jgi:hypothetical protein
MTTTYSASSVRTAAMWFLDHGGWRFHHLSLNWKITFSICSKLAIVEKPAVAALSCFMVWGLLAQVSL